MGSSQQFSLRWNNYLRHITSAFDSLRSDLDLVDVTLSCEGKKIKAHKMLLSACSTYFKDLFKENPCQHPVIIFRNVNFSDLEALVDFMYQGEVNVVQEQLASFLTTAELLAVQGLTDGNGQELAEGLDMQAESSEALGGAERSTEKKLPNNDSSSSFYSSNQNPMSPPAKRKKWNTSSSPSSSQRASSDLTERRRTAQISSDGVTNPVDIIPVMSQVKVEIPEFLDSGQISFNNTGQEGNPLSDLSVLDHNMPNTSRGGKEESGDVYGGSANDAGDIAGEQMTPAELSEVLSKAGPSSDGSQDSLQARAWQQQALGQGGPHGGPHGGPSARQQEVHYANIPGTRAPTTLTRATPATPASSPRNMEGRRRYSCQYCPKTFAHHISVALHMSCHQGKTVCPICHKVFSRAYNLKLHMNTVHSDVQWPPASPGGGGGGTPGTAH